MLFEIIIFLGILTFLVFIHELGHFLTAKNFGIRVEEFGIGLPPRAIGKKIGDTIYSLNWLPLGGFVQIKGENFDETFDPKDQTNFLNKKPWQRTVVLLAGVFMNFIFAVLVFYFLLGVNNWESSPLVSFGEYKFPFGQTVPMPNVIMGIAPESAAAKAGFELGDQITSLNYQNQSLTITGAEELGTFLADKADQEIEAEITNLGTGLETTKKFTPMYNEELKQPALGVTLDQAIKIAYQSPTEKAFSGLLHPINLTLYNFRILGKLAGVSVAERNVEPIAQSLSGPIGIFDVVKTILNTETKSSFYAVLDIAALISLSLVVMNLLPIPALDGGRVVFVLIEWITGKKVPAAWEARAHQYGFMFLITLIIAITFKDVWMLWIK